MLINYLRPTRVFVLLLIGLFGYINTAHAQLELFKDACFNTVDTFRIQPDTSSIRFGRAGNAILRWSGSQWLDIKSSKFGFQDGFEPPPCPNNNKALFFGNAFSSSSGISAYFKTKKTLVQGEEYLITIKFISYSDSINSQALKLTAYPGFGISPNILFTTRFADTTWTTVEHRFKLPSTVDSVNGILLSSIHGPGLILPSICSLGEDTSLCANETIVLDAGAPGSTYLWQDNSSNRTYKVSKPGIYTVMYNNEPECIDSVVVRNADMGGLSIGNDTVLCPGESFLISPDLSLAESWYWQDGSTKSIYKVNQSGNFKLTATNRCGTSSNERSVDYYQLPDLDQILCENSSGILDATSKDAISYLWDNGNSTPLNVIDEPGRYFVDVTWPCGTYRKEKEVEEVNCACNVYVPNSFTPNGDGLNDHFSPEIYCNLEDYQFTVFSRWGDIIYQTKNPFAKWDGSINGNVIQNGLYAWKVDYSYFNEKKGEKDVKSKMGKVTVIK